MVRKDGGGGDTWKQGKEGEGVHGKRGRRREGKGEKKMEGGRKLRERKGWEVVDNEAKGDREEEVEGETAMNTKERPTAHSCSSKEQG